MDGWIAHSYKDAEMGARRKRERERVREREREREREKIRPIHGWIDGRLDG